MATGIRGIIGLLGGPYVVAAAAAAAIAYKVWTGWQKADDEFEKSKRVTDDFGDSLLEVTRKADSIDLSKIQKQLDANGNNIIAYTHELNMSTEETVRAFASGGKVLDDYQKKLNTNGKAATDWAATHEKAMKWAEIETKKSGDAWSWLGNTASQSMLHVSDADKQMALSTIEQTNALDKSNDAVNKAREAETKYYQEKYAWLIKINPLLANQRILEDQQRTGTEIADKYTDSQTALADAYAVLGRQESSAADKGAAFDAIYNALHGSQQKIYDSTVQMAAGYDVITNTMDNYAKNVTDANTALTKATEDQKKATQAVADAKQAYVDAKQATKDAWDAVEGKHGADRKAAIEAARQAEANEKQAKSQEDAAIAAKKQADQAHADAVQKQKDAKQALLDAQSGNIATEAGRAVRQTLEDQLKSATEAEKADVESGKYTKEQVQKRMDERIDKIKAVAKHANISKDVVKEMVDTFGGIPMTAETIMKLTGNEQVSAEIKSIVTQIADLVNFGFLPTKDQVNTHQSATGPERLTQGGHRTGGATPAPPTNEFGQRTPNDKPTSPAGPNLMAGHWHSVLVTDKNGHQHWEWYRFGQEPKHSYWKTQAQGGEVMGQRLLIHPQGLIEGPGHATADLQPTLLSPKEFVQPADAVTEYGVPVMKAIQKRRLPAQVLIEMTKMVDEGNSHKIWRLSKGGQIQRPDHPSKQVATQADSHLSKSAQAKRVPFLDIDPYNPPKDLPPTGIMRIHIPTRWPSERGNWATTLQSGMNTVVSNRNAMMQQATSSAQAQAITAGNKRIVSALKKLRFLNRAEGGLIGQAPAYHMPSKSELTAAFSSGLSDAVKMANGGLMMPGLTGTQMMDYARSSVTNNAGGFHIENMNINNPVPERSHESLYRTARKLNRQYD